MKAYKLVRKLKDNRLAPLFINMRLRYDVGKSFIAECHIKPGFAIRQGFHCTLVPLAPHLSKKDRVWIEVEISNYEYYKRPKSQGGTWVLAQEMKVIKEL